MSRRRAVTAPPSTRPQRTPAGGRAGAPERRAAAGSSGSPSSSSSCSGSSRRSASSSARSARGRLVNNTGWWTRLRAPLQRAQWTLENYRDRARHGRVRQRLPQQPGGGDPGHRHPDHDRGLRGLRLLLDGLPGPARAVRARRRADGRAAADGPDPDPAALHRRRRASAACTVFPDLDLNGTFLGIWLAHTGFGLPLATYLLAQLHRLAAVVDHRVGQDRRRRPLHDLLPPDRPAVGARRSPRSRIFQFLWVWNDLLVAYVFLGGTRGHAGGDVALADLVGFARRELAPAHLGGVHLHGRCRSSCSSRCSATSSAA